MKQSALQLSTLQNVHDSLHVRVLACHNLLIDQAWDVRNVRSSFWRLYLNRTTGAEIELPHGVYPLTGCRVHLIPAWVSFSCRCTGSIDHLYIHFELLGMAVPVARKMFDRPMTLPADAVLEKLCLRLSKLTQTYPQDDDDPQLTTLAKSAVYLSLSLAIKQQQAGWSHQLKRVTDQTGPIWPALQYTEAHLCEPISNEQLASQCNLSCDHFAKRFRQIIGQTPARYVLERRIAQTAQRLIFTNVSIDRIAQQCGFTNRFHFTRVFTRYMGIAPAAYRQQRHV